MYGPSVYSTLILGIRGFFGILDSVVYTLISGIYQIFFNIASSTLFDGEVIKVLFSRVQLILGVIMLFKLAINLINGIINPESIGDKKNGFGNAITRIVVSLVMLVLIVPLNIPGNIESGSYNAQLNNNGILFGTMYEFQNRILSENTIGNIILNKQVDIKVKDETTEDALAKYGNHLSAIILKTFINPNITKDSEENISSEDDYAANTICSNTTDSSDLIEQYNKQEDIRTIIALANNKENKCTSQGDEGTVFMFNYSMFISTLVGVLFLVIMAGFTLDVAIRALKLVILRIIAPIPIIAYISPNGDNNFKAWTKAVLTTYVDVFVRVAVVYFIVFIIDQFTNTGIILNISKGPIGVFSKLFILLGLFYFAKEAPKFLLESIGIKYQGGFFSGIGKMMGAAAIGAGALSSGITGARAARDSYDVNHPDHTKGRLKRTLSAIGGGALGTLGGTGRAISGAAGAKDHYFSNAMKNVRTHNNELLADASVGGTWWARTRNNVTGALFGDNDYDKLKRDEAVYKRQLEDAKAKDSLYTNMISMAEKKATKSSETVGRLKAKVYGEEIASVDFNYADYMAQLEAAKTRGVDKFTYTGKNGRSVTLEMAQATNEGFISDILDSNTSDYAYQVSILQKDKAGNVIRGIDDKGLHNSIDYAIKSDAEFKTSARTSESFLGDMKKRMGDAKNISFAAQNRLNDVQEKLPKATANVRNDGKKS